MAQADNARIPMLAVKKQLKRQFRYQWTNRATTSR